MWFGVLSVYALVHIFAVKDFLYAHTGLCELATRLPIRISKVLMSLLNCQLCMGFWLGLILCGIVTLNASLSVVFGLACYGFIAIASRITGDTID